MYVTKSRLKNALSKAALVLTSMLLSFLLAECLLRLFMPQHNKLYVWQPNLVHTFYPSSSFFPGIAGPSKFSINNDGFRGDEFDEEGSYAILCVGGSTTECLYLDDVETWPALLKSKTGIQVGSIGKSGCTLRENYMHIKYYVSQLNKVDAVMLMVGINDMMKTLSQYGTVEANNEINATVEDSLYRTIFLKGNDNLLEWYDLRVIQLLKEAVHRNKGVKWQLAQDDKGEVLQAWRNNRSNSKLLIDTLPNLELPLKVFEKNLALVHKQCQLMNKKLILVNQAGIYKDSMSRHEKELLWMGGVGPFQLEAGHAYYTPRVLRFCLGMYNQVLKDFSLKNRDIVFIDLDSQLPKDTSVFYDDCHFNEHGARQVADIISTSLTRLP